MFPASIFFDDLIVGTGIIELELVVEVEVGQGVVADG